jgi:hypothetical protein
LAGSGNLATKLVTPPVAKHRAVRTLFESLRLLFGLPLAGQILRRTPGIQGLGLWRSYMVKLSGPSELSIRAEVRRRLRRRMRRRRGVLTHQLVGSGCLVESFNGLLHLLPKIAYAGIDDVLQVLAQFIVIAHHSPRFPSATSDLGQFSPFLGGCSLRTILGSAGRFTFGNFWILIFFITFIP